MLYNEAPRIDGPSVDTTDLPPSAPTARRTFQSLRMVGLSTSEAGNLTAHLTGLRVSRTAWTVAEIERLIFLRALVDSGRLTS